MYIYCNKKTSMKTELDKVIYLYFHLKLQASNTYYYIHSPEFEVIKSKNINSLTWKNTH